MTPKRILEEACMIKYGFKYNPETFKRAFKTLETTVRLNSWPSGSWSNDVYCKILFDHYDRIQSQTSKNPVSL